MHTRAIAAAAVCLGLAAGCSSNGGAGTDDPSGTTSGSATESGKPSESGSPSATTSVTATPPADGPVTAFDSLNKVTFPEAGVRAVAVGEDTVLTLTAGTLAARSLPTLDGAYSFTSDTSTYADLWAEPGERFGYLLEVATEPGTGTSVGHDQITVSRFEVATGELHGEVSTRIAQDPLGTSGPATGQIVAVQGSRVVVDSAAGGTAPVHAGAVLDVATERTVWKDRGSEPLAATPKLVLLNTGRTDVPGEVVARTLRSGERRWRSLPGTISASLVGTTASSVVIARDNDLFSENSVSSLALRSGRDLVTTATEDADWACTPGSRRVAVCSLPESHQVLGWDLTRHRPAWTLPSATRFAPIVTLVQDGLVYGILDSGTEVVLDARSGKDVKNAGGAAPAAVNAYGGVVLFGDRAIFVPVSASGVPVSDNTPAATPSPTELPSESESPSESPTG